MEILPSNAAVSLAPDLVGQLHMAGSSSAAQSKVVSEQFEAVLLRQFLDKSVGSMMGSGGGNDVYGYMLTDALSQSLAKGGGLGMASILQRQLSSQPTGVQAGPSAAKAAHD
jgi:Rod binding domain-containing protein